MNNFPDILFISTSFSGMESYLRGESATGMPAVQLLLDGLVTSGMRVTWLLLQNPGENPVSFDLKNGKIRVIYGYPRFTSFFDKLGNVKKISGLKISEIAYAYAGFRKAMRITRQTHFSLVYGASPLGAFVAGLVAFVRRLPRISRLYGSLLYFLDFRRKLRTLIFPCELFVFKYPGNALIMTNDGTRGNLLAKRYKTNPDKFFFVMNGIDKKPHVLSEGARIAQRNALGIPETACLFMTLCRLENWKRVDRSLKAIASLKTKRDNYTLLVVGEGFEYKNLVKLSSELGISDRVKFLGAVPHEKALSLINICDIFLSLYDYSNLGNPIIEAMIAGKCIVSIDDGSLKGIITSNINGILLSPSEIENKLPQQLDELMENVSLREKLSAAAGAAAAKSFLAWNERISFEIEIIEKLCLRIPIRKEEILNKYGL